MKQDWTWRSARLPEPARVARWGHFGQPVLLFPTAGGDFEEVERFKLIAALAPLHYLPGLADDSEQLRQRSVLISTGEGDYENPAESWRLANVLGARGVPNRVDLWGPDSPHSWVTWQEMLPRYLHETT